MFSRTTVQSPELLKRRLKVADYAELRNRMSANAVAVGDTVQITDALVGGVGVIRLRTSEADNLGTIITDGGSFFWERKYDGQMIVDWFGVDGTRSGDSAALRAALAAADGEPVKLLKKRYYYDGTTITESDVRIDGSGMPQVNAGKTALEGGSIIDGSLSFTSQNVDLRNFGADVGSASSAAAGDAIRASAPILNAGGHLHTENIIGLCKSSSAANHALLFQSYLKHTGTNLYGIYSLFGFVSKCQNVDLGLIHTVENDESGVLLKSDTGFGRCRNVSIQRVICECGASQKRGFHVQSSDDGLRDVQIGLVKSDGAEENVLLQVGASGIELRNISIDAILSKNSRSKDVGIDCVNGTASIFNVDIGKIISEGTQVFGLRVLGNGDTDDLNINSMFINYEAAASQAVMDASCFIGTNCTRSRIRDMSIIRNFSTAQVGGITYNGNVESHVLGSVLGNVFGLNRPANGVSEPSLSGTGNSITVPQNSKGDPRSHIRVAPTGVGVEIDEFLPPVAGAENFQKGHVLTILNNSLFAVDILHGPANGIYNNGGLTKTIQQNEVAMWIYGGSDTWHGVE